MYSGKCDEYDVTSEETNHYTTDGFHNFLNNGFNKLPFNASEARVSVLFGEQKTSSPGGLKHNN